MHVGEVIGAMLTVFWLSGHSSAGEPTANRVKITSIPGMEQWAVRRTDGPPIDVYVTRSDGRKPLVVLVQGSHCLPLFMEKPHRRISTLFVQPDDLKVELSRVSFAVVERRGLKSFGPVPASEPEAKLLDQCTPERGGVSKVERVADVAAAIRALAEQPWVGPIYVLGHSEGADVAAGVGRELDSRLLPGKDLTRGSTQHSRVPSARLAGVGLLSGAGATRFFDDIALAHQRSDVRAVKQVLDDLIALTGSHPPPDYAGASSVRQLTYAVDSTPLEDLQTTTLPLFVAAGSRDEKSPQASADLFVAEMLRSRARPVHYLILPEMDHGYESPDGKQHVLEVIRAFVDWTELTAKDRAVAVGLSDQRAAK